LTMIMKRILGLLLAGCFSEVEAFVRTRATMWEGRSRSRNLGDEADLKDRVKHLSMGRRIYIDEFSSLQQKKYVRSKGLSRDEEMNFSRLIKNASRIKQEPSVSGMDHRRQIIEDGVIAQEALVTANIGLVVSIAKRYYYSCVGTILSQHDLVQEGMIGLMDAAERFEPEKGFKFSTYATWWIRQRILRSINNCSRTIRLPAHMHSTLQKIHKSKLRLRYELRREPTMKELANDLDIPVDRLQRSLSNSRTVLSLELMLRSPSSKGDTRTIGDFLACDAPSPEEEIQAEHMKRDILEVVDQLPENEKAVILSRFGLKDGKPRSREETSLLLGIQRDRVRRIEARALNKLRNPQRNYRLKAYVTTAGLPTDKKIKIKAVTNEYEPNWLF
jgi:RNA polymerase sigma factor (sigma-70 family)